MTRVSFPHCDLLRVVGALIVRANVPQRAFSPGGKLRKQEGAPSVISIEAGRRRVGEAAPARAV